MMVGRAKRREDKRKGSRTCIMLASSRSRTAGGRPSFLGQSRTVGGPPSFPGQGPKQDSGRTSLLLGPEQDSGRTSLLPGPNFVQCIYWNSSMWVGRWLGLWLEPGTPLFCSCCTELLYCQSDTSLTGFS